MTVTEKQTMLEEAMPRLRRTTEALALLKTSLLWEEVQPQEKEQAVQMAWLSASSLASWTATRMAWEATVAQFSEARASSSP